MIDPNNIEECAKDSASALGGAYLQELMGRDSGKITISNWTKEEWLGLVDVIVGGYVANLCDQQAAAAKALAKVQTPDRTPWDQVEPPF
jgi:formylmethanofuran:tetrahydromethanopterin formyltransferase